MTLLLFWKKEGEPLFFLSILFYYCIILKQLTVEDLLEIEAQTFILHFWMVTELMLLAVTKLLLRQKTADIPVLASIDPRGLSLAW